MSLYAEAVKEAERHKWIESQKHGRDLGQAAIRDWYRNYWNRFCRWRRMEHLQGTRRWREFGEGRSAIDDGGSLPGGESFEGIAGLRRALVNKPDVFVTTLAEKLLTFALGRGVDYRDAPAIRQIRRAVEQADYKFSSLIVAITRSAPFQMRSTAQPW